MRLHQATGDPAWADKAEFCLQWLIDHQSPGYSGAAGAIISTTNLARLLPAQRSADRRLDLAHRARLPGRLRSLPQTAYLEIAVSACEHILRDLRRRPTARALCISYIPIQDTRVHNANTLGGSLLARTWSHTGKESWRVLAEKSMRYTAQYQRPDGSWYYGEPPNLHWVDNFHTAYVLDCFRYYLNSTGDHQFDRNLSTGYEYWKKTFFLADGTPRYYDHKTLPIDIQCSSQAIDTLVFFSDRDPEACRSGAQSCPLDHREHAGSHRLFLLSPLCARRRQQDPDAALGPGNDDVRAGRAGFATPGERTLRMKRKVLIIVENLPFPLTLACGGEALSLRDDGYDVPSCVRRARDTKKAMNSSTGSTSTVTRCLGKGTAFRVPD